MIEGERIRKYKNTASARKLKISEIFFRKTMRFDKMETIVPMGSPLPTSMQAFNFTCGCQQNQVNFYELHKD